MFRGDGPDGGRRPQVPPRPYTDPEPHHLPGRTAGRLDQLDEHAVAGSRVDERDRSFGPAARRGIDQLETGDLEAKQRLGEVGDLEADVMEALALRREKARHPGRIVGRLDELDLRLADREEGDPDAILIDLHDRLEIEPEGVPPQPERILDRLHDQRDVVHLAEPADGLGESRFGLRGRHPAQRTPSIDAATGLQLAAQMVISSRCSPQATRSRSLISPTVA